MAYGRQQGTVANIEFGRPVTPAKAYAIDEKGSLGLVSREEIKRRDALLRRDAEMNAKIKSSGLRSDDWIGEGAAGAFDFGEEVFAGISRQKIEVSGAGTCALAENQRVGVGNLYRNTKPRIAVDRVLTGRESFGLLGERCLHFARGRCLRLPE